MFKQVAQGFFTDIFLRASRFPFGASVIGVAFLYLGGDEATTFGAMDEATENEILGDFPARLALARHDRLHLVKKFL